MTKPTAPALDLSFLRDRASRRRIAATVAAFAGAGLLYGLLAPRWYRSEVVLVPAKPQKGGLSGILGGDLGGLGAGLDLGGGGADTARIAAVLQSTTVADAAIEKLDLKARYGEQQPELARAELWKHCDVRMISKPNLVQISCEDRDPRFTQELLSFLAAHGNEVFRRVNVGSASEEVRFLERRVADLRKQADESAARMREFQERNHLVDLDSQAKALVGAVASLNAQRLQKKVELGWARSFATPEEPGARQLASQLSVIDETLRDLEVSEGLPASDARTRTAGTARGPGAFPGTLEVPALRAEYEKLYRDRKVAEATLIFALDRLESARASEARDVSTFQILDPPALPTRKSRPRVSLAVLFGAAAGLAAGVALEWLRAARKRGDPGPAPGAGQA